MKTTITFLKLSAIVGLIFMLPNILKAQESTPTVAYLCGDVELTLKFKMEGYTLNPNDVVYWQRFDDDGPLAGSDPIERTGANPDLVLENLTEAYYQYRVWVVSADPNTCTGDLSEPYEIHVLPTTTVELTTTSEEYCEAGTTNVEKSVLTAEATPSSALPTGVSYVFDWSATQGSTDIEDLSTIGTEALVDVYTSTFTMTTVALGAYTFTAAANYDVPDDAFFKSEDTEGCVVESTPVTVTVTPKPGQPTVTFQ